MHRIELQVSRSALPCDITSQEMPARSAQLDPPVPMVMMLVSCSRQPARTLERECETVPGRVLRSSPTSSATCDYVCTPTGRFKVSYTVGIKMKRCRHALLLSVTR